MFGDLLTKMKTNPVMNEIFQDPHKGYVRYTALENVKPSPIGLRAGARIDPMNMGHWSVTSRLGKVFTEERSKAHQVIYEPPISEGARKADRILYGGIYKWEVFAEGDLYWENMLPDELYDLKSVKYSENPLLNKVRGSKIKITNTFQSFSK